MNQTTRLLLLAAVLLSAIIVAFAIINRAKTPAPVVQTPTTPTAPAAEGKTGLAVEAKLTRTAAASDVAITLKPSNGTQKFKTIGLQILFTPSKGTLIARSSTPAIGSTFKGNGWTIPFSNLTSKPDGSVVMDMSAIYASPEPFVLSEPVQLATVSLSGMDAAATLTYTINDPTTSKAFDEAGNVINFTSTNVPLTITE